MNSLTLKYKFAGNIFLWKYLDNTPNYPGWNFSADKEGGQSLSVLLGEMLASEFASTKTIQVSKPSNEQVLIANNASRFSTTEQLILKVKKKDNDEWNIEEPNNGNLIINLSGRYVSDFKNAVLKISNGQGDFAIADDQDQNILYFWW